MHWKRQWQPTLVLLPGKSHGWRSLVGCSPWVAKSRTRLRDFTFTFHFHALEKEMATHSSVLAWRIPGMGEPGGLPSTGSHRVRHDWSDLAAAAARRQKNCIQKNNKTLMKEINNNINRWRDIPCCWVGRSILWKWWNYQMQSTDSMWSLSNYQCHFSQN